METDRNLGVMHPLHAALMAAANGQFPTVDGLVDVFAPAADGVHAVVEFTGHAMVLTDREAAALIARGGDGFGGSSQPDVIRWLAGPTGVVGSHDVVLVARGRPSPSGDVTVVEVDDTLAAFSRLAADARARVAGPVVTITGSNGKTTTRAMVAAVVAAAGHELLCTRGNLNNHLGVPLTLCGPPHEPSALVVELGMSAPGENDHLARIVAPNVAVVTSIALEHVEFLGSLEAIAAAEAEPLAHLPAGGLAVLPADEPRLRPHWPAPASGVRVHTFGPDKGATVRIDDVTLDTRTHARFVLPGGRRLALSLAPLGLHNARNAAAALCVGLHLGVDPDVMAAALEAVEPVGDRGRTRAFGSHLLILDCYNANPGSMEAAVRSLAALGASGRRPTVAVLGDMLELGPNEAAMHRAVGELCAKVGLDAVVTVGARARHIAAGARGGHTRVEHVGDDPVAAAARVRALLADADGGAVLLKASRGMRLERVADAL